MEITKKIQQEIHSYKEESVEIFEGYTFSAYRVIRRIGLYKNQIYPTGKFDSQGNYKYWYDIITPRVNSEVKNVDFDTKDIKLFSEPDEDYIRVIIANAAMSDWLRTSGEAKKINTQIVQGTEDGNIIYKKMKGNNYETLELFDTYVINTTAKTLEDSDIIEHAILYTNDMRKKQVWDKDKVQELIEKSKNAERPEFHVYERNGELTEKEFNGCKGIDGGSENKFLLVKVIVAGIEEGSPTEMLFCDTITKKPYKEYHRAKYAGKWLRMGMYEILFDDQMRANEIGNQIARGLEYASKTIFRSSDQVIAQNILIDLQNGDIIKSQDLQQVQTRMEGFDQLIADWNRVMEHADKLANSFEIVTGENLPSGTPFRLARVLDNNATKLFNLIRENLGIALQDVINDWILPKVLSDIKARKVLKLTADSGYLEKYYQLLVENWYRSNLLILPPHTTEEAQALKTKKIDELLENDETALKLEREMWDDFKPRAIVSITGENITLQKDLETLSNFITLELDPIRRTHLIEKAMKKSGIDVSSLPKTEQPAPEQQQNPNPLTKKAIPANA